MKFKSLFILILSLILLFLYACSKSKKAEKPEWKGKIETEEGVKVVKNPAEPVYGEVLFYLDEVLSIGREDDENYLFYGATDIVLDQDDNIYVLEYRNFRIQKFDKFGNYLQTIGKKGQGPGEFEGPIQILLDRATENIYVKDRRKIKIFDKEGNYLHDILLKNYPYDLFLDAEGGIWGKFSVTTESGQSMSFDQVNAQGETVKTISSFPYGATFTTSGDITWGVSHGYIHDLQITKIDDRTFCYGYSENYELNIINIQGKPLFKIQKEEPRHPIIEKEKDKIRGQFERIPEDVRKAIQFPEHRPFFGSIFSDDKGRIYVNRIRSPLDEEKGIKCDIFSKEGYYLYRTTFTHWPQVIKEGYFCTITTSEESGEERVKRFLIKNWEEIKENL